MKTTLKKVIAIVLSLSMLLACTGTVLSVSAQNSENGSVFEGVEFPSDEASAKMALGRFLSNALDKVFSVVTYGLAAVLPGNNWENKKDFKNEGFLEGSAEFSGTAASGWQVGYSSESIVPDDFSEKGYTQAGEFHLTESKTTKIVQGDDQCFRAVAVTDGREGNTVLFCSIDGFGFTSTNVRAIRTRLADFAKENGIVSINITSSHAHSCIDIHGLGAPILTLLGKTVAGGFTKLLTGKSAEISGTDEAFMNNVFAKAEKAIKAAVADMKPGVLTYSSFYVGDMLHDKQLPVAFDENINQIKFSPNNKSAKDVWLVNLGLHPVRMGGNEEISSDYPGALVRYALSKANAQVAFYQGAQAAISRDEATLKLESDPDYTALTTDVERDFYAVTAFAKQLVDRMMNDEPVQTLNLEPVLNIKHSTVFLNVTNNLMFTIAKINMINNLAVKTSSRLKQSQIVTEVGYCELGKDLAIAIMPGELSPEIAFGGTCPADEAWNGTAWEYDTFTQITGKKVLVFGITNDQIGYIVPDNDFAAPLTSLFEDLIGGGRDKHYEEMISLGINTASSLTRDFEQLVDSTEK